MIYKQAALVAIVITGFAFPQAWGETGCPCAGINEAAISAAVDALPDAAVIRSCDVKRRSDQYHNVIGFSSFSSKMESFTPPDKVRVIASASLLYKYDIDRDPKPMRVSLEVARCAGPTEKLTAEWSPAQGADKEHQIVSPFFECFRIINRICRKLNPRAQTR